MDGNKFSNKSNRDLYVRQYIRIHQNDSILFFVGLLAFFYFFLSLLIENVNDSQCEIQKCVRKSHIKLGFPGGSDSKASACNSGDSGLIPGLGRSLGEGNSYPLQYSCLSNIPWTEEPGRLQSVGSQRVGHDRVIDLHLNTHTVSDLQLNSNTSKKYNR